MVTGKKTIDAGFNYILQIPSKSLCVEYFV
jgi:hypothetical protein